MTRFFDRRKFVKQASVSAAALLGLETPASARELAQVPADASAVTVRFRTNRYAPPAVLELKVTSTGAGSGKPIAGQYSDGAWTFRLPVTGKEQALRCVFLLDGAEYGEKSIVDLKARAGSVHEFDAYDISLTVFDELAQSRSPMMERMFRKESTERTFDVIVVGSGMGGGALASRLADRGLNVAVLEAGSLLFPTHIGNLPRPNKVGAFSKHIWELWYRYGIRDYVQKPDSVFQGAQGFNIGGRSLFWGALIPRMSEWELAAWPEAIRAWLLQGGYAEAERLVKKSVYDGWSYQETAKAFLAKGFPAFDVQDAPLAIDYPKSLSRPLLPDGVFSTADLLMESILTGPESNLNYPRVFERHPAVRVNHDGGRVQSVTALDLDADRFVEFKARAYVLAAGSLASAKIALASKLEPHAAIGRGFTDHPVFYTHFGLPRTNDLYRESDAAKILMQRRGASQSVDPFNVVIELGADLNHGRFIDPSLLEAHGKARPGMLCEVVFLASVALDERNGIAMPSDRFYAKPVVQMHPTPGVARLTEQIRPVQKEILARLGAVSLPGETLELKLAPAGGVAHEAGSLRMSGGSDAGVVDQDLRFHRYENLWACDLSVFPTSPAANPALTLVALSLRLADHLKARLS